MKQNWYRIIGLNPDGKKAGKPYTEDEIKKAYHKESLNWHPDKNQSADAKERFQQLKEARDFLMNKDKREAFYDELAKSPDLFPDSGFDLMLITRERPSPAPVASVPVSPSTAMIVRPPHSPSINDEVNISDFFHHARADVIAYASSNPDLARAIFKNGRIVSTLSLEKQYELMLVTNHHAVLRQQQDGLENDFAREAASYLDSLENNRDNQEEFVTACCKQLSLVPSFYQAYPEIISGLHKDAFYRLASKSEGIVGALLATCPKDKVELLFQAITDLAERKDRALDKAITNALQDPVFFSRIPAWIIQEIADRDRDSSILLNPAAQDKLRMLDQWKEELKDADRGNLSPPEQQARLESLLELSKAIGIDRHLLQTIQASLVHQPVMQSDLYHRLLEIRPSLLSDTDRRNINTRIQEIENKLPLDRSPSHDAALRRIENDRDSITGSELMQFVREFGEPMRQVIRDEKLDDVLLYAEQLEKLWQPLKDKTLVLEEKEIEKPGGRALCMVDLLGSITGDEKWTRDFCEKHHLQIEKNAANPSARMTFVSRDPDCRIVLTKNKIGFSRMPGHEEMRISVPIMVDIYIRGIRDNHAELRHVCGCADPVVLDYMERTLAGKLLEQGKIKDKINGKGINEILYPPIKQEKARHPHIS